MKKLILLTLLIGISAHAGNLFSTVSGMLMQEVKPQAAYTVDTNGLNPRVYEFRPVSNPKYLCVIMFPNSDGKHTAAIPAMQCFKDN